MEEEEDEMSNNFQIGWVDEKVEILSDYPEGPERPVAGSYTVPMVQATQEDKILVAELLEPLSPIERKILVMYYVEDMTQQSIADELRLGQPTISRTIAKCLDSIRQSML